MYAVVKTGGKQYRVEKNDVVLVEKLSANDGDQVVLDKILMIQCKVVFTGVMLA